MSRLRRFFLFAGSALTACPIAYDVGKTTKEQGAVNIAEYIAPAIPSLLFFVLAVAFVINVAGRYR